MFDVLFSDSAADEYAELRGFERGKVEKAIEENLVHQPDVPTRNRKPLPTLVPSFEHVPPVWELRVGGIRVFYDVDVASNTVTIRAIREKGRKTSGEIT